MVRRLTLTCGFLSAVICSSLSFLFFTLLSFSLIWSSSRSRTSESLSTANAKKTLTKITDGRWEGKGMGEGGGGLGGGGEGREGREGRGDEGMQGRS